MGESTRQIICFGLIVQKYKLIRKLQDETGLLSFFKSLITSIHIFNSVVVVSVLFFYVFLSFCSCVCVVWDGGIKVYNPLAAIFVLATINVMANGEKFQFGLGTQKNKRGNLLEFNIRKTEKEERYLNSKLGKRKKKKHIFFENLLNKLCNDYCPMLTISFFKFQ